MVEEEEPASIRKRFIVVIQGAHSFEEKLVALNIDAIDYVRKDSFAYYTIGMRGGFELFCRSRDGDNILSWLVTVEEQ